MLDLDLRLCKQQQAIQVKGTIKLCYTLETLLTVQFYLSDFKNQIYFSHTAGSHVKLTAASLTFIANSKLIQVSITLKTGNNEKEFKASTLYSQLSRKRTPSGIAKRVR